ncbi:MAG: phage tail tape measure protein [Clostridia bacterium]|nr:phage tail tape measure protein [Clostridia bacterium]
MASNRIKGITIEIGGDTSNLQKSLSGVDKALQNTQTQLRDVNKLLKLDPHNTELLEQKQRLLGDAIKQTSDKLATLKESSKQAEEALKSGAMTQDQYDGLQREIIETENSLKGLKEQAEEAEKSMSKMAEISDKLGAVSKKTEEVGKSLTKNVTAPIVGIGAAAYGAFNEVDNGLDTIAKKTGATGDELSSLEETAKNVFGSMPVDIGDVGAAVGEINTRFGLTGQALEDMTKDFLKFASINDADVETSIANVDKIMTKFGVDSNQTVNVLGLLTSASQKSGISIDALESSLENNGAALKELGFDITESVNLLSMMESNGVDTSTAMTSLSKAVQNATKDGKDAETAMREQIDAIKNAKTETEALQIATELFGKKGAAEMTQSIRDGRLSVDELSGSLTDFSTNVEDTFSATQDSSDEAKVAFNNLKLAGSELGGTIGQVLTPILQKLSDAFKGLSNWYKSLSPQQQEMVVKIALIAATIGPLLIVLAKLIAAVQTILTIMPAVKGAILAVNAAMAANPIAMVVLAIAGLVAAFKLLWDNCEEFREFWGDMWEALQEGASIVIDGIGTAFEQLGEGFQTVGDGVMLLFDTIGTTFSTLGDTLGTVATTITDGFQTMGDTVGSIFNGMWEVIKSVINTIIGGINGMIAGIEGGLNAVIGALNTLHWEIPSWVPGLGGKGFGFDIPKANFGRIPELANGAVINPNSPFLAVLGDQQNGTNIEAPLNTIKQALIEAMGSTAAAGQVVIPVYIGQERIQTIVANANVRNNYISGGR